MSSFGVNRLVTDSLLSPVNQQPFLLFLPRLIESLRSSQLSLPLMPPRLLSLVEIGKELLNSLLLLVLTARLETAVLASVNSRASPSLTCL